MSLICAISNEPPEQAVISPVSGAIFERRLIEKFIVEHATDPTNGEPLSADSLIEVKSQPLSKPRPPSVTSIPAILKILQDEWDGVMLHSFTLRKQLQTARQELSHALYQHDSACRVIARLNKELTAAREALATLKPQALPGGVEQRVEAAAVVPGTAPVPAGDKANPDEPVGMSEEVLVKMQEKGAELTKERKQRGKNIPPELASAQHLATYKQRASHVGVHSASMPGILSLDVCLSDPNRVVTGGADKNVAVFDKDAERVRCLLRGHTKRVSCVLYHPYEDLVFSSSPDCTVRAWSAADGEQLMCRRVHDAAVNGISLHATGDYLLSCGSDAQWALTDIRAKQVLTKVADDSGHALTCCEFHPDGLIFGTGAEDSIRIWDLKERRNVANFPGHSGAVSCLAFSENGYYLASAAEDSVIKLWDLRKLKNFKTLTLEDRYEVRDLRFDHSGQYLGVAGTDVRVYIAKQWNEVCVFNEHTALATGIRFGRNADFIASTSMDRTLKFFSG